MYQPALLYFLYSFLPYTPLIYCTVPPRTTH